MSALSVYLVRGQVSNLHGKSLEIPESFLSANKIRIYILFVDEFACQILSKAISIA